MKCKLSTYHIAYKFGQMMAKGTNLIIQNKTSSFTNKALTDLLFLDASLTLSGILNMKLSSPPLKEDIFLGESVS